MKKRDVLFLLAILILGLALRLPNLGYSFYGDETFTVLRDSKHFITPSEDRFRPVFFTLIYLWRQLGFHDEIGLRLLPLLFGLAQIPLAFLIGRKIAGEPLARAFGLLIALSPMLIEFSQELRMYSLVACLALAHVWILLRLREKPSLGNWIAFTAVGWIGVYTHLHYWLFIAGLSLSLYRERQSIPIKHSIAALAALVLLYLPNLPNLLRFSVFRGNDYAVHLPSALLKLIAAVTVGFNYFALPEQAIGRAVGFSDVLRNPLLVPLVAIPVVLLFWGFIRLHRRRPLPQAMWLSYELFVVPTILAFIASAVTKQYWLQPKYVIFIAPFTLLLIVVCYQALASVWLRRITAILGLGVFIIAYAHFLDTQHFGRRENWKDTAAYLRTHWTAESAVLVLDGHHLLLDYYWPEGHDLCQVIHVPKTAQLSMALADDLRARLTGKRDVVYVWNDIRQNVDDPRNLLVSTLDTIGQNRELIQFNPRNRVYRWTLPGY
jgi:uncharacterized membrane protein